MPLWGKLNQPVTVTANTVKETTQGAPIGTWKLATGGTPGGGVSPMNANATLGNTSPGSKAFRDLNMYGNTTPGAFIDRQSIGVFGVTANQFNANRLAGSNERPASPGWVVRRAGTGGIVTANFTGNTSGYSNTDVVMFNSPLSIPANSTTNATCIASVSTNSTGGIVSLTITKKGHGFTSVNNNPGTALNANNGPSSGTGGTFNAIAGGRAGRVSTETLVAMSTITNPNTYIPNTVYPGLT